ncbi:MAG: sodium:proton antiporter [Cyanothece sp. SIO2G6]|nr:sodium:proton antiporter [Cyanothece sp. SIO2G6]
MIGDAIFLSEWHCAIVPALSSLVSPTLWPLLAESATESQTAAIEEKLAQFLLVLCVSLSVAALSRTFSLFRQIPYTLLLVIVGLGLAILDIRLVTLSPELILLIFLPPLLFEAGWNLEWANLKKNFIPICLFAIIGVVISVGGIALGLNAIARMTLGTALLVGASLSATDPVSVIALFRDLGVDKRLTVLMEGESLFNDGVAVVAFTLLIGWAMGTDALTVPLAITKFLAFVGIGAGVGAVIGFGISFITQRFDIPSVEQSLTLIAAYGTYVVSEELGGSGVIAVVTVGLIMGNFGSRIGMNPRTRLIVSEFWEFISFFVNSIVFLLIGDQVRFASLGENFDLIMVAIASVIATRAVGIYGLSWLSNAISNSELKGSEQTVLWWGGLRGSVSVALALSVPEDFPAREEVIATVFGVMLFTLLVQGLTTKPLLERLELLGDQPLKQKYLEAIARRVALDRVLDYLKKLADRREIEEEYFEYQTALVKGQLNSIREDIAKMQQVHPEYQDIMVEQLREEMLAIESDTYADFIRSGRLKDSLTPLLEDVLEGSKRHH